MKFLGLFSVGKKLTTAFLAWVTVFELMGAPLIVLLLTPLISHAAEVTISTTPSGTAQDHTKLGTSLVFIDDQVGYKFYRYGASPNNGQCGYSKTTNGGDSWGSFVPVDTQTDCIGISIWYDKWTPGDSGDYVHVVTIDTSLDEMFYNRLDTTNDSLLVSTSISACSGCAGTYATATNKPSITKSTAGLLYIVTDDGNGTNIRRCTTNCGVSGSWSAVGTPPQGNANSYSLLVPVTSGNVMLINRSTTNVLRFSIWNGGSWSTFSTIDASAIRNTTYDPGINATVDIDTGDIYLAYVADNNNFVTTDHDIRTAVYNGSSWTNTTDAITNHPTYGILQVAITRNQNNGAIYVVYTARTTIGTAASANVYSKRSTDGMSTWESEQGPYNTSPGDIYGIDANPMNYERIYASWFNSTVGADVYGNTIADIGPEVVIGAQGSQITEVRNNTTNNVAGGSFTLTSLSNRTVSSVVITEEGTVHAQDSLSNIKLYYESDTSAPYDCASESYNGTESQFGSTAASFSGANGVASFTNSPVNTGPTNSICFYLVYDTGASALNGETIEFTINDPSTDVILSDTTAFPFTPVELPNTTTVVSADLTQFGYHWRQDNGSETTASSATGGVEDTPLTALQIGVGRRVRIGVANQGSTSTVSSTYQLEYGEAAPTCEDVPSWTVVGSSGAAWLMRDSANITDGNNTTNIALANGGLTDLPSTSFIGTNGALKDTSATTSSLTLDVSEFLEFEYSIVATTTASQGSTYCFRMSRSGTPLSVYTEYPRATIAADVTVQPFGTQVSTSSVATSNVYSGGGFRLIEASGSRSVTDITISESGTIDASLGLDNIKLFYELDTSNPYDCTSESYAGTESQFGSTVSSGFSAADDTASFSDSVGITTTASMCVYVVYDVTGSAQNGDTIDISINSPATDVVVSGGGSVGPSTPVALSGETTIEGPILEQLNYHWRNDNGSETGATSATGGAENTALTDFSLSSPIRLRFAVTNTGLTTSVPTRFRLEYAPKITTCDMATVWTNVDESTDGWDMYDSTFLTNGETTTNIAVVNGGVSNGVGSFIGSNGGVRDTESLSATTTIPVNDYLDLEYSLTSTQYTTYGTTYCFRVSANGTALGAYGNYAEITTSPKRDFKIQRGSAQVSGTSVTLLAGTNYTAPASTSRAYVRITNSHMTGAGDDSLGGAQNADDTTAYISDPGNIGTSFTIARPAAAISNTHVDWEIVEFIGQPDTDNEIIVRDVGTVSFSSSATTVNGGAVSGVEDNSKIVVYITGIQNLNASRNFYAGAVTSAWDATSSQPVFTRAAAGASAVNLSYVVVEYRGINWNVQRVEHTYTAAGVVETEPITAVNSLARTFIHAQKRVGATTNVLHFGHEVWLSSIGAVSFQLESGASVAVEQTSVVWIIENTQTSTGAMSVQRSNGNTTGGSEPLALGITLPTPLVATNNTSIEGNTRAAGNNTSYPRPIAGLTITSTSTYQIWRSDTGSLLTYRVELIEWPVADLSIRQNYYRFYVDNNELIPSDPWPPGFADLGENTSITNADEPLGTGDRVRIRMTLRASNTNMPAGFVNFKLQYGFRASTCSAVDSGSWFDVGQVASSTVWRGYAATGTTNGTALSTNPPTGGDLLLSVADVAGSLVHENPSAANPYATVDGDIIEYDWYVEHNGAIPLSTYCFRAVRADGTPLEGYSNYPQIRTAGFTPVTRNWRWYQDEENETPTASLATENVAPINIADTDTLALRVSVYEKRNVQGTDLKFKLQFSDDISFANPVDVVATSTCGTQSLWCYEEGGGVDNSLITTSLLSDADACVASAGDGCGTHNTSPTPATGHVQYGNTTQEYSFTIRNVAARVKAVYYFRLYDVTNDAPVTHDTSYAHASLVTEGPLLTLSIAGLPAGTSTAGVVTDVTTTANSVGFGDLAFNAEYIAAHRVSVTTNATEGYQVLNFARQQLTSSHGVSIPSISGTNATPTSWSLGCGIGTTTGCVGYHTTDATLRGGSTRFAANDTYAGLETEPVEVMYSSIPANQDTHDIVYRVTVNELQPAGLYETEIVYLAVPSY